MWKYLQILFNPVSISSKQKLSLWMPIFGSHIQRIGWIRTVAGGTPMYFFFPVLVGIHLSFSVIGYPCIIRMITSMPQPLWKDYIVIDRYKIRNLALFDRFNCIYCGYANGVCTLINDQLNIAGPKKIEKGFFKLILIFPFMILMLIFLLVFELSFQLIYNLMVSRPLKFKRVAIAEVHQKLINKKYAINYGTWIRRYLLAYKNFILRLALALEQIESAWCPLKHLEQNGKAVYPPHHKKFFESNQIEEMRIILAMRGTVSNRQASDFDQ